MITTVKKHLKFMKNLTNLPKKFCEFPPRYLVAIQIILEREGSAIKVISWKEKKSCLATRISIKR